jgi:tight adherence protein B
MITPLLIIGAVFVAVATLIAGVGFMLAGKEVTQAEERLDALTGGNASASGAQATALLATSLDDSRNLADDLLAHFGDIRRYLAQADLHITTQQFLLLTIGSAAVGFFGVMFSGMPMLFAPLAAIVLGAVPFGFVFIKRKRRINAFARLLPDALELISRALRAGHSLGAGFNLVGDEMSDPVAAEFARCYEEQNLGIPLEQALENMTERVPNLDLRFFATAVILQRQTGGDLAEILDKIGHLVRERFQIWGQIQALTGEGRLSGIVLLALPPVLFVVMYKLNPDYVMVLFTDPIGKILLSIAVFLQLAGALVIKKIINIKV